MKYGLSLVAVLFAGLANGAYAQTYVTGISTSGVQTQTLQFYADQCGAIGDALPNDGAHDDALPLRNCMAAMPAGSTMNLDGTKPYLLGSHSTSDAQWGTNQCEIIVRAGQTLNTHGATLTMSASEATVPGQPVCMGANSQNTPFGSGTEGVDNTGYLPILATRPNATTVTVTNSLCPASGSVTGGTTFSCCTGAGTGTCEADAANINAGDDLYIDCGSNPSDADIFVGYSYAANGGNGSTGVIQLGDPLLKPYSSTETGCPGGVTPRIYDYTTGNLTNGQPLAHGSHIIGGGTWVLPNSTTADGVFFMEGCVDCSIEGQNVPYVQPTDGDSVGFTFSNNNHHSLLDHDRYAGTGFTGDTEMNAGEFTSSFNVVSNSTCTESGINATSASGLRCFGDSEGDESNSNSYDTCTILAGGSPDPNKSNCLYAFNTWGETFDHMKVNSAYDGFVDGPTIASEVGPTYITNSMITAAGNGGLVLNGPDTVTGNTVNYSGSTGNAIQISGISPATIADNILNITQNVAAIPVLNTGAAGYSSVINGNTINCPSGDPCASNSYGIEIGNPGSSLPLPLTIYGNNENGVTQPIHWDSGASANLPNARVSSCSGVVTLSSGSATVSNTCIGGSQPVTCTDNTTKDTLLCTATAGSLAISGGTGTDSVSWAQN